ncbi:glycine cleavage system protein GcvH [Caldovatus aquaticus]|uniref:Glycine cleavage system H protein n=1 Tax=Caldovatus aquaticus TaxID=2865671 RepID=A0ABS7EXK3_9PROT|nr:glycine cleavage system protein GcvH [Caldovatus aquaticus]MBW8268098.1 glycine cleavage system protein GcvH [Caldovatus aquaticus]
MSELRYTKDHEWLRTDGDAVTVGISDHAQSQLGDVVFVELPEVGREVEAGEAVAVVESVKAASDVYAPVSGRIVEVNSALAEDPGLINRDPTGEGWFFKIEPRDPAEIEKLMDEAAYAAYLESQA